MIVHDAANRVVKLQVGGETCAVRMPRMDDSQLQVDRNSELAAVKAVSVLDLAPEVLSFDAPSGVMITRWIDEPVWTPEAAQDPVHITLIASALRRLHALETPTGVRTLNLRERLEYYWDELSHREARPPPRQLLELHQSMMRTLERQPAVPARLCHNDLNCGNLIGTGATFRILDWEYAGLGDPLFDLASYARSNGLDRHHSAALLDAYGADSAMRERFPAQCELFDWICVLWKTVCGLSGAAASSINEPSASE